ncbi:MAG TPA: hypothetical protein VMG12_40140 [Polyangiaceae bacterium]|nr:hypothetical protein [Polyangiaceae bacterium]
MRRASLGLLAALAIAPSAEGVAQAEGATQAEGGRCRNIRAEIDLSQGTIAGNFGLNGGVVFTGDGTGTPPPTAPATSSVFSGLLEITTVRGSLTFRETGMFSSRTGNPDGAVLTSWGDSPVGTGVFEGVTGDLFFAGRNVDGVLLVQVLGRLCRP